MAKKKNKTMAFLLIGGAALLYIMSKKTSDVDQSGQPLLTSGGSSQTLLPGIVTPETTTPVIRNASPTATPVVRAGDLVRPTGSGPIFAVMDSAQKINAVSSLSQLLPGNVDFLKALNALSSDEAVALYNWNLDGRIASDITPGSSLQQALQSFVSNGGYFIDDRISNLL